MRNGHQITKFQVQTVSEVLADNRIIFHGMNSLAVRLSSRAFPLVAIIGCDEELFTGIREKPIPLKL